MKQLALFTIFLSSGLYASYEGPKNSQGLTAGQVAAQTAEKQDPPEVIAEAINVCKRDHESKITQLKSLAELNSIVGKILDYIGIPTSQKQSILQKVESSKEVQDFIKLAKDGSSSIKDMEELMTTQRKGGTRSEYGRNCGLLGKNILYHHHMVLLPAIKKALPTYIMETGGVPSSNCPKKILTADADMLRKGQEITAGSIKFKPIKGYKDIPPIKNTAEWRPTLKEIRYDQESNSFVCKYKYPTTTLGIISTDKTFELAFNNLPTELTPMASAK